MAKRPIKDPKPLRAGGFRINPEGAFVYRAFDAAGRHLYIGFTTNMITRMQAHRMSSPWWADAVTLSWEEFATREEAAAVELALIAHHRPPHNIQGTFDSPRFPLLSPRAARAERQRSDAREALAR